MVSIDDFLKIDMRVGRIVDVREHSAARKPMYVINVDLGPEIGVREIVAGIRDRYSRSDLIGKKIICVVNLDPKSVAGVVSNGMLLAAEAGEKLALLTTDKEIEEGSRVH